MIDRRYLLWPGAAAGLFLASGLVLANAWWMAASLLLAGLIRLTEISISKRHVTYAFRALDAMPGDASELEALAAPLAARARLAAPRVFVVPAAAPMATAFVGGRNDGFLVLSSALVDRLTGPELSAVLAHELAHLRLQAALLFHGARILGFAGLLNLLLLAVTNWGDLPAWAFLLLLLVIAPLVIAVSLMFRRASEYEADRLAAELCGEPLMLAAALEKTEPDEPARAAWPRLPAAHPPVARRIARLKAMAR